MEESVRMLVELLEKVAPSLLVAARQDVLASMVVNAIIIATFAGFLTVLIIKYRKLEGYDREEDGSTYWVFGVLLVFAIVLVFCNLLRYLIAPEYQAIKALINLVE